MTLEVLEHLQDAVRGRGLAFPVLWVEGQHPELLRLHRGADLALNEGLDQQGDEVEEEQSFDAALVLQEGRSNGVDRLELLVPLFEVGLVLVFLKDIAGG